MVPGYNRQYTTGQSLCNITRETLQCGRCFAGGCKLQYVGQGVGDGSLNSLVVTSYRLPIVTIGLSLTVFAVLRLVMDRQTDGIGIAKGSTMH